MTIQIGRDTAPRITHILLWLLPAVGAAHAARAQSTDEAVAQIDAGAYHTCAVTRLYGAKCWGYNLYGQLGDASTTNRHTPISVSDLPAAAIVATGANHTCALTTVGGTKCWGSNYFGQLGDGTQTNRSTATNVSGLSAGVAAIATGGTHTCALTTAGAVKCWGSNSFGQLGNGMATTYPVPLPVDVFGLGIGSGITAITAGSTHTCALSATGEVFCWGRNQDGQLGNGTAQDSSIPVAVSGLSNDVVAIAAGASHTCALDVTHTVRCWGSNHHGQLGDGTTTGHDVPVAVSSLAFDIAAITAGTDRTCALTMAGMVKCWGAGGLGDGTTTDRHAPVDVSGMDARVTAIAAGNEHICALTAAGAAKCWGYNAMGQLGDDTTTYRLTPVDVVSLSPDAIHVSAAFSPGTVAANEPSRLTITLANEADFDGGALLESAFVDTLPDDLVVAETPDASTTCADGAVTALAGGQRITLDAGAGIPAEASCVLSVNVVAATQGVHADTIPARSLHTWLGSNPDDANAILTVGTFPAPYCSWGAQGISPIIRVVFSDITHNSDPDYNQSPEHEDFTSVIGTVSAGTTESLWIRARTWLDQDPSTAIAVYFDWNRDDDFDDANEAHLAPLIFGSGVDRTVEWNADIPVPQPGGSDSTAMYGTVRMRVVALGDEGNMSDIAACGARSGGGQAEDYTLIVYNEYIFANGFD